MERRSQEATPEVRAAASLPDREAIRDQELERVLLRLLRGRPYVLPALAALLLLLVLWAPAVERVRAWVVFAVPMTVLVSVDRWRVSRGRFALRHIPFDILAVACMQALLVSLTGQIDSPLLPVLVVMAGVSGAALGPTRAHVRVVAALSLALWGLLVLELDGRWSQWAALLVPPPLDEARLWWRAGVVQALMLGVAVGGTVVHGVVTHGIDTAIDARERLLHSLASRNAELSALSGALAHELKNPLASIHGLVTLIERGDDNRARRFQVLQREIERMKTTVDELLDFSREADTSEPIGVAALCQALSAEREAAAEARGVRVEPPALDHTLAVRGDARKLRRALANLLDNAIEASPADARVEWVVVPGPEVVELGVADRGPGLPHDAGRPGFSTKPQGSGFGLAVSRTLAEQLGGELVLRARPGGGAEVVLRLARAEVPS